MKLINDDCLKAMKDIEDNSIDLILTDPPYGTTACKWDSVIPFEPMWTELNRIIKKNGCIALFGSQPFTTKLINSNFDNYKFNWIWDKVHGVGFQIVKYKPLNRYEDICIFSLNNNRVNYYPQLVKRDKIKKSKCYSISESSPLAQNDNKERIYTHLQPTNIIKFSNASQKNRLHPTQKPVELLEYLIRTYTKENEIVLDFTMGSGSTGIACLNTDRKFIGIEMDKDIFKTAKNRIENHVKPEQIISSKIGKKIEW